jgi:hypothetical protein
VLTCVAAVGSPVLPEGFAFAFRTSCWRYRDILGVLFAVVVFQVFKETQNWAFFVPIECL